jgi:hypothetical protein
MHMPIALASLRCPSATCLPTVVVNNSNTMNAVQMLKLNPHHLPALELPEFVEVRKQL